VADPRVRAKKFLIQPKNIDGENVGKSIVYTWEQLKEIYSDKASKYDLDTTKGYRAFKKAALKELNKKHSPEYQRKLDRGRKAAKKAADPEGVAARQAKYDAERRPRIDLELDEVEWRNNSLKSIDADVDGWIKDKIRSSAKRYYERTPEVLSGRKSASVLAKEYLNGLTDAQMSEWDDVLRPIKGMNDSWHQVALDSGDPKHLDNIIEVHHTMPLGKGGTGLSPKNIIGASGKGKVVGAEHGRMHSSILGPQYEDVSKSGGGVLHYAPEGSGGIDAKMYKPKWDKESGKLVYELSTDPVPGLSEYKYDPRVDPVRGAGFSDAPKHTPSIMNLKWLRNLPSYLGAAALLGTSMFPSREASADTWYGRMGQNLKSPYHWADFITGLDSRGMVEGIKESLLDTQESRKKRYEDLLMSRRHRKRKEDLRDQGLLGVNI
jgi:hypothetical protein